MRTEGQVKQKLKQAQYRHLKRELRRKFGSGGSWPPEEVEKSKAVLRQFFSTATIPEVAQNYPDVAALMWVLGDQSDQDLLPYEQALVGRMGGVLLWADSEEGADVAREMIDKIVEAATREQEPSDPMNLQDDKGRTLMESGVTVVPVLTPDWPSPPRIKKSWWQRLFG